MDEVEESKNKLRSSYEEKFKNKKDFITSRSKLETATLTSYDNRLNRPFHMQEANIDS